MSFHHVYSGNFPRTENPGRAIASEAVYVGPISRLDDIERNKARTFSMRLFIRYVFVIVADDVEVWKKERYFGREARGEA